MENDMAIEFEFNLRADRLIDPSGLIEIDILGTSVRIHRWVDQDELEQILAKMKELQGVEK